jgi:hypothetical protein
MSDSAKSTAGTGRVAEHNVVASYTSPEAARAAITALERKGIEGGDIEVTGPGVAGADMPSTNEEQRDTDMALVAEAEKRGGVGLVIGALIGAVIGAVAGFVVFEVFGLVDDMTSGGIIGAALAGAAFGAFAGFFYGGASGLPVSEAWSDTFEGGINGETRVVVHTDEKDSIDAALETLRGTDPVRLTTFGRDRRIHEVR